MIKDLTKTIFLHSLPYLNDETANHYTARLLPKFIRDSHNNLKEITLENGLR